jgi:glycosyltransferase involved in cell wall biosynthesis
VSGRLAVLISFSGEGGVERMVLNLVEGFADQGRAVDLLTIRGESAHLASLPASVRRVDLGVRHSATAVLPLIRYLRRERPTALLAAKDRAIRSAALARQLANRQTRLVGRLGTNLSAALAGRGALARKLRLAPMRWIYPLVDHVVAVSDGVAKDTCQVTGLAPGRISVVRNPVVTPRLSRLAEEDLEHPWLAPGGAPVILGAGRLTAQKDFATLVRAFAQLRTRRPARLVILGEGRLREPLQALARELGVADDLALPGFAANPYPWMRQASVFTLSSAWEGSPNVLTEAMALGTAVAATDCPSGPREILAGGRYGPLVPVGDWQALAAGMLEALDHPIAAETLRAAVADYAQEASARRYLELLDGEPKALVEGT